MQQGAQSGLADASTHRQLALRIFHFGHSREDQGDIVPSELIAVGDLHNLRPYLGMRRHMIPQRSTDEERNHSGIANATPQLAPDRRQGVS